MGLHKEEPGRCGGGRGSELECAGQQFRSEDRPTHRRLQQLKAARDLMDAARLRLLMAQEHLRAAGVDVDDAAFLDDVKEIVRDLNRLILAGGKVELLGEAFPAWARAATVEWREQRDRQRRWRRR